MASPLLLDREFLRTLEQLSLVCRQSLSGTIGIDHRSRNRGPGVEFTDYRRYTYGDDPRFLDWNAYLRLGKLFLKIYQTEEHIPVRVLVDTSLSMNYEGEGESKFVYAQRLAATFAYLALLRLDTAAVVPFAEGIQRPLVVSGGRERFFPVLQYLSHLQCAGRTVLLASVKQFLASFSTRGVAIVVSDFFDSDEEGCQRAAEMLRFAGHDFVFLQVHSAEEQRPSQFGELELEEVETRAGRKVVCTPAAAQAYERAFLAFAADLERVAVRNGGRYVRAVTAIPYQSFILQELRGNQVLE